jgi:hypothetical protein
MNVVNTEVEQADSQALRSDLESASLHINVSYLFLVLSYQQFLNLTPFYSSLGKSLSTQSPKTSS